MKHTPTPWEIDDSPWSETDTPEHPDPNRKISILGAEEKDEDENDDGKDCAFLVKACDEDGPYQKCIASVDSTPEMEANAALIIRAVNCHEELLTAAKAALNHLRACEKGEIRLPFKSAPLPLLEQAIAKAEMRIVTKHFQQVQ